MLEVKIFDFFKEKGEYQKYFEKNESGGDLIIDIFM